MSEVLAARIEQKVYLVRGQKVMLAADLAKVPRSM